MIVILGGVDVRIPLKTIYALVANVRNVGGFDQVFTSSAICGPWDLLAFIMRVVAVDRCGKWCKIIRKREISRILSFGDGVKESRSGKKLIAG